MKPLLIAFLREEAGQDVVEFTLLLAFVVLMAAAICVDLGMNAEVIWGVASDRLKQGETIIQ